MWGLGGSKPLGTGGGNTTRSPYAFRALGLSLAGGPTEPPHHGWLCFTHPWTDKPPPQNRHPRDRWLTRFWELLAMEKKFPALQVTHGGDNWLHRLFFFLLLPKETIISSARHWDTTTFAVSLCFV